MFAKFSSMVPSHLDLFVTPPPPGSAPVTPNECIVLIPKSSIHNLGLVSISTVFEGVALNFGLKSCEIKGGSQLR